MERGRLAVRCPSGRSWSSLRRSGRLRCGRTSPLYFDRSTGWWCSQEQSLVRAAHRPVCCHFVALVDFVFNGTVEIGEGGAEHRDQVVEPVGSRVYPGRRMADAIGRDHVVHNCERSKVEGVKKQLANKGVGLRN